MIRLDRYLLKELFFPFLIGTVALVLMLQANTLIAILKIYNTDTIPATAMAQLILFKTPEFLKITLPAGIALSTSLALSRLVRESELTAIRAVGCPIRRVIIPIAIVGFLTSVLSFVVSEKFQPEAEQRFKKVMREAALLGPTPTVANNVMLKLGNRGYVYVRSAQKRNNVVVINGIMLVDDRGDDRMAVGTAKTGSYDQGVWKFPDMIWRQFEDKRMVSMFSKETVIDERIEIDDLFSSSPQAPELTLEELKEAIERGRSVDADTSLLEIAYQVRFALPAACFCFAITGPVMAIMFGKRGGFVGVFISMLLVTAYLNIYVISTEIFGKNGWFTPIAAAWFPNVVFLIFGIWGMRRIE